MIKNRHELRYAPLGRVDDFLKELGFSASELKNVRQVRNPRSRLKAAFALLSKKLVSPTYDVITYVAGFKSQSAIIRYFTSIQKLRGIVRKSCGNEGLLHLKARLLGYAAAEGYVKSEVERTHTEYSTIGGKVVLIKVKYSRPYKRSRIVITNKDPEILKTISKLHKLIYGVVLPLQKDHVVLSVESSKDLLRYSQIGSKKWRVPIEVVEGKEGVKANWLRGYTSGDGCVEFDPRYCHRRVILVSTNLTGLLSTKGLLEDLGILGRIYGPYGKEKKYHLVIPRKYLNAFHENINFDDVRKRALLFKALKS